MKTNEYETYRLYLIKQLETRLSKKAFGPRQHAIVNSLFKYENSVSTPQRAFITLLRHFGKLDSTEAARLAISVEKRISAGK